MPNLYLGDDDKVKINKKRHVASFPVNYGGSIMMSKIATGWLWLQW